jgi:hypothetical protein
MPSLSDGHVYNTGPPSTSLNEISGGADTSSEFPIGTGCAERAQILRPNNRTGLLIGNDAWNHRCALDTCGPSFSDRIDFNSAVTNSPIKVGGSLVVFSYLASLRGWNGYGFFYQLACPPTSLITSTMDGSEHLEIKKPALVDLSGSLTLLETPNQDYDTAVAPPPPELGDDIKLFRPLLIRWHAQGA